MGDTGGRSGEAESECLPERSEVVEASLDEVGRGSGFVVVLEVSTRSAGIATTGREKGRGEESRGARPREGGVVGGMLKRLVDGVRTARDCERSAGKCRGDWTRTRTPGGGRRRGWTNTGKVKRVAGPCQIAR
jgi:hypothetical protein